MLCSKCGALIGDDSVYCSKCGAQIHTQPASAGQPPLTNAPAVVQEAPPPDPVVQYAQAQNQSAPPPPPPQMNTYLTQNILLTVFSVVCCMFFTIFALPTAVTGLVFSAIAQGALKQNDTERARQYIRLARIFMWISFGIEIVTVVIYIVFAILGVISFANMFQNNMQDFDFDFDFDQFRDFGDRLWR